MICHVVLLNWNEACTDAAVQAVTDGLAALPGRITQIRSYHFGPDLQVNDRNADYVLVAETDSGCSLYLDGTELVAEGCNVNIRNGEGSTATTNGTGNLIVGYDEDSSDDKTGSHNLVVGAYHSYSNYGGFVAGYNNEVSGAYAGVSGGLSNVASGGLRIGQRGLLRQHHR